MDRTDEIITEAVDSIFAVADTPCTNKDCALCDGKCAQAGCGGYKDK